jgi:hypothetical protein
MPAGVAFALKQHRDFSQPFCPPHSPPGGIPDSTAKNATKKKPTLTQRQGGNDQHQLHPEQPQIAAGPSSMFPAGRQDAHPGHPGTIEDCLASRLRPKDPDLALELDRRRRAAHAPTTSCTTAPAPPLHHITSTGDRPKSGPKWA